MAEFTFAPLTPASFLDRAAAVFGDRTAIVDGDRRFTYRDMSERCRRLAGALAAQGADRGDKIAALCANSHVMLELHHAVPMTGAALVTLNTRLSEDEMAALLDHSGSSVLVATSEFADRARRLADRAGLARAFSPAGPATPTRSGSPAPGRPSPGRPSPGRSTSTSYWPSTTPAAPRGAPRA